VHFTYFLSLIHFYVIYFFRQLFFSRPLVWSLLSLRVVNILWVLLTIKPVFTPHKCISSVAVKENGGKTESEITADDELYGLIVPTERFYDN